MSGIETIKKEYKILTKQLSNSELISNWGKFEKLSKRKIFLEKIITKESELQKIKNKIEENREILNGKEDSELLSLAKSDTLELQEEQKLLEKELKNLISENSESETPDSVIVEIRAGTGGEEAALFTASLFRMYSKYAQSKNWKQKILDSRPTELGGFKEIIFELTPSHHAGEGKKIYSEMKYEGGVHRVQRIPKTEKGGRVHTSTSSVAVLPKPKTASLGIKPEYLKIDFYRASGPGGQYVNKRETAVRITHLPTGLVVTCQTERNQIQNKENAMKILKAKLLEKKQMAEIEKLGKKRKTQIGWAKRAEKIRTYNFPQNRITDHRIKKSWHNLEEIMDGKLDKIIKTLQKINL